MRESITYFRGFSSHQLLNFYHHLSIGRFSTVSSTTSIILYFFFSHYCFVARHVPSIPLYPTNSYHMSNFFCVRNTKDQIELDRMIRNNLTIERKPKYYEDKYCVRFVQLLVSYASYDTNALYTLV
ncbi:unnamed protein product [Albugo candida]|uniref:Uncharacterized protein n=1 Tax=Albugo candida TaxID=65357 RepID=A0A024G6I6_9STRA|nr:unnamed protein product [Albugo candida]|eukprot:CCI42189.1 unnamed protein product [Albugo candida]